MDINYYKKYEPVFGVWKIKREIGEGSYGKVFELEREDFGRVYKAALKAVTIPRSDSEIVGARAEGMDEGSLRKHFESMAKDMVDEFAILNLLKGNSNVVSYENHQVVPHEDGIGWDILIQMELLTPLNDYAVQNAVTRRDVIRLGIDLCKALELCQKYGVMHRDVKPENIFVSANGDFKLGDFGIARKMERHAGSVYSRKGTNAYMAPEVYKEEDYDSTVDIYSLGIVMYRLLNGRRTPFLPQAPAGISAEDRERALMKRMSGAPLPKPIHAEGRLAEIVLKACAYNPRDRYSSPGEMRRDLEAILYNQAEGPFIYPEGDEVPQDSYASTGGKKKRPPQTGDEKVNVPNEKPEDVPVISQDEPEPEDKTHSGYDDEPAWEKPEEPEDRTNSGFDTRLPWETVSDAADKDEDRTRSGFDDEPSWEHIGSAGQGKLNDEALDWNAEKPGGARVDLPRPEKPKKKRHVWMALVAVLLVCVALAIPFRKRLTELFYIYIAHNASVPWSGTEYLDEVRDLKGRVVREPSFNLDGTVTVNAYSFRDDILSYSYSQSIRGGVIEATKYIYTGDRLSSTQTEAYSGYSAPVRTSEYTYTADGVTVMCYTDGQCTGGYHELLDAQGNILRTEWLDAEGSIEYITVNKGNGVTYGYDAENNLTQINTTEQLADGGRIYRSYSSGGISEENLLWITCYNALGQVTSQTHSDDRTETNTYNSYGQRETQTVTYTDGRTTTVSWYTYDDRGNLSAEKQYEGNALSMECAYQNGKQVRKLSYDQTGQWVEHEWVYDENGNELESISYSAKGVEDYRYKYDYDDFNQCRYQELYSKGELFNYQVYEYDSMGRRIQTIEWDADGKLKSSSIITYHDEGRTQSDCTYNEDGSLSFEFRYEYDAKGKRLRCDHYNGKGELMEYSISYYNGDGKRALEQVGRTFDADDNSVVEITFESLDPSKGTYSLESYSITRYDENGNFVDYRVFDAGGNQTYPGP